MHFLFSMLSPNKNLRTCEILNLVSKKRTLGLRHPRSSCYLPFQITWQKLTRSHWLFQSRWSLRWGRSWMIRHYLFRVSFEVCIILRKWVWSENEVDSVRYLSRKMKVTSSLKCLITSKFNIKLDCLLIFKYNADWSLHYMISELAADVVQNILSQSI